MERSGEVRKYQVAFQPDGVKVGAADGDTVLEAARRAGVNLTASCGGEGVCGACRVRIDEGQVETLGSVPLEPSEIAQGLRLACRSRIRSDLTVSVPPASRTGAGRGRRALATAEELMAVTGWRHEPPVAKYRLALTPPTPEDNSSDLTRLDRELSRCGIEAYHADLGVLRRLPHAVREGNWKVTVTILKEPSVCRLLRIEPGDTRDRLFGLAFDIGTTGVRGELLDLNSGKVLARGVEYNGQRIYGDDVISRIAYSAKPDGMARLQQAVVSTLNAIIASLLREARIPPEWLSHMTFAANTTMTQLLLGIDPRFLRLSPYVPSAAVLPAFPAGALGIDVPDHVLGYALPSVASYVGGDIVSGLVGTGIYLRQETVLYIDIGTNGETVVGNADWMVCAACSAGPAFEGGGICCGMLATDGAIEGFDYDPVSGPILTTIGGAKPRGICGAGLISIVSGLLAAGVINPKGRFQEGSDRCIRSGGGGLEYLLAPAGDTETGKDIVITEADIGNLIRAKAAMYAGYRTLLQSVGLAFQDLDKVVIAGTFGSHLDIEEAIAIGLMPDMERSKFFFIGNGSLLGARLSSFSSELIDAGRRVARMVTNVELSERVDFMDHYVAALFLPHTDASLFPGVSRRFGAPPAGGGR